MKHFLPFALAIFIQACATSPTSSRRHISGSAAHPVCDLITSPETYRNTVVIVRGRVVSGFETFALVDDSCPADDRAAGMIWLTTSEHDEGETWADVASAQAYIKAMINGNGTAFLDGLMWYRPVPTRFHEDGQWRRLLRLLKANGGARATITGRFDYASGTLLRRSASGTCGIHGGFGHLNAFSRQVVISSVSDVSRGEFTP